MKQCVQMHRKLTIVQKIQKINNSRTALLIKIERNDYWLDSEKSLMLKK